MIREHQYRSDDSMGPCTYTWHITPCSRAREDHEQVDYKTKALDEAREKKSMKSAIIVYIDLAGAEAMIEHILDGTLRQYHPSVTVGSSLYGVHIPMMNAKGEVS